MKNIFGPAVILLLTINVYAQTDFKYDSIVYKTIFAKDLCAFLKQHPDALLIDVRSPGEYADTSGESVYNIGHLEGAVNIPIDSFPAVIPRLNSNKNRPIVLYCSHSQRSRRVSKILSENGFTGVRNLNGGMSRLTQAAPADFPCKEKLIVSNLPYKNLPAAETVNFIEKTKDLVIIDVRTAEEFANRDTLEENNIGRLKHALNIPWAELKADPALTAAYKNKPLLIYSNGNESGLAANYLYAKGFTGIHHLLGGLDAIIGQDMPTTAWRHSIMENMPAYKILNAKETLNLLEATPGFVVLDIRSDEIFNNKSPQRWRNLGHIKNAIHIVPAAFIGRINELEKYKNTPLLLYGTANTAKYAKQLSDAGFTNVNLLYDGLWALAAGAANAESLRGARAWLADHEGLY